MQKVVASGLDIITLSDGNILSVILSGCTKRNATDLGAMGLDDELNKAILDKKARREQFNHTEELGPKAV